MAGFALRAGQTPQSPQIHTSTPSISPHTQRGVSRAWLPAEPRGPIQPLAAVDPAPCAQRGELCHHITLLPATPAGAAGPGLPRQQQSPSISSCTWAQGAPGSDDAQVFEGGPWDP